MVLALLGLALMLSAIRAQQQVTVYDASQYVLIDARLLRAAIGYNMFSINKVDTLAARHAQGLDLRIEARLVSGLVKKEEGFVIADAFYLDLTLGMLSSEPLYYYTNPEDRFSTVASFGYSIMAGYSTDRYAALAGKSIDWTAGMVGGSSLPGPDLFTQTGPWLMRLEFRPAFSNEFRVMLTGWDNFNNDERNRGFRVDVPFLPQRRFWITYSYSSLGGLAGYATFDNAEYAPGILTQHMIGLRDGSIYCWTLDPEKAREVPGLFQGRTALTIRRLLPAGLFRHRPWRSSSCLWSPSRSRRTCPYSSRQRSYHLPQCSG